VSTAIIGSIIPFKIVKNGSGKLIDRIYRAAVKIDTFWLESILGLNIEISGHSPSNRNEKLLVISNHQSWFDIFILQSAVTGKGPLLKFLVKRALVYVPVIGWICLALNFPLLNRSPDKVKRRLDYDSVASAAIQLRESPVALLNFVEGTRFTEKKKAEQNSPYEVLLKPRSGGLKIMMDNLPEAKILDITLIYPNDQLSFWQCLSGRLKTIKVHINEHHMNEFVDINNELEALWRSKDQRIIQSRALSKVAQYPLS